MDDYDDDDFDTYHAEAMKDPDYRDAYEDAAAAAELLDTLVALRKSKGVTQTAMAAKIGVRQPTLSEFEREGSDPFLSTLQRYARSLGAKLVVTVVTE